MKLTSKPLAAIVFVIFLGGIALTSALGWFKTTNSKTPLTFKEGEFVGQFNPADIRGSYSFGDISRLFELPLADLQNGFQFPAGVDPAAYQVKNLEAQFAGSSYEIGTASIRMFVALYKGLPFDLNGDTYLPQAAAAILESRAPLTPQQSAYLKAHSVDLNAAATPPPAAATTPAPSPTASFNEHIPSDRMVSGKTSFQDLIDWGVSPTAIEQIIGAPLPAPTVLIKDYLASKNLEFSTLKSALQAEVDQHK